MDPATSAVDELRSDHRRLRRMYREWEAEPEGTPRDFAIVDACLNELEIHSRIEQEIFYPECQRVLLEGIGIINDFVDDHLKMDAMIRDLRIKAPAARRDDFQELMTDMLDHFEREEKDVLSDFEDIISSRDDATLVERLRTRKEQLRSGLTHARRVA